MCSKLNVNIGKLADLVGAAKYVDNKLVGVISKSKASEIITKLNKFQQEGIESIPKELKGYEKIWEKL